MGASLREASDRFPELSRSKGDHWGYNQTADESDATEEPEAEANLRDGMNGAGAQ